MAKPQKTKPVKKAIKNPHLTVNGLLGAISYWGSAARLIILTILILFAFLLNISEAATASHFDMEIILLIYGLATVFVLDVGYVMAARALPLNKRFDRWVVSLSGLIVAGFFIVPSLIIVSTYSLRMRALCILVALLVVSVRILLGLILSTRKRK